MSNEREKIHHDLLEALYTARKQVEYLEAALAHNAAFLGTGVERADQIGTKAPDSADLPDALLRYIGLVEPENDISDYIGREGDDQSRPRLGPDAPAFLRPDKEPEVSPLVGQLALDHPADAIVFGPPEPETPEDAEGEQQPDAPKNERTSALTGYSLPPDEPPPHWQQALGTPDSPYGAAARPDARPDTRPGRSAPAAPEPPRPVKAAPTGASDSAPRDRSTPPRTASKEATGVPRPIPAQTPAPVPTSALTPAAAPAPETARLPKFPCASAIPTEDECKRSCLAMQAINDGIWDWNMVTGQLYCSPRWREILGPPPAGEPLESLAASFDEADRENLETRLAELLEGKASRMRKIVRFFRGDQSGWGVLRVMALKENDRVTQLVAVFADITAQREAELALRESNEKFRALAEDSPDVIGRFGPQGEILYVSPNISRYSALTPDDIVGRNIDEVGSSAGALALLGNIDTVFATGQPLQNECALASPLVGRFVADCRFWPEFGVNGEVVSVSVQARDMTHVRRIAENYYALFNNMEDGFVLFEHLPGWEGGPPAYTPDEFAAVIMNPAFVRMFGLKDADTTGMRLGELVGADADVWGACLGLVLTHKRPVMQPLHSEVSPGEYDISAYSPEQGRVACIVKDVTELHRIEQETRLNEARLAALYRLSHMDAAPEDRVVHYCLEQAVNLTGSGLGYLYISVGEEGDGGKLYWSRGAKPGGGQHDPIETGGALPWRDSETFRPIKGPEVVNMVEGGFSKAFGNDVEVSRYMLAPIAEEGRIVCLAGVANKKDAYSPSDLRQLELFISGMWFHMRRRRNLLALRLAKEEAEAANRAKNEFLANVSHELRTPLNGILGLLQVLQQSRLTDEQMECVNTATYSSRSLLRIISDILDFSRIEAGTFELTPQLFDFAATVRSALGMFIHPAGHGKVRFTLMLDPLIPKLLVGDDARVRQIIVNLVGNAFKFTQKGEINVECRLLPYCKKGKRCIYLAVADTGIGIPEDRLEYIFKAFTQLDGSSTRRYPGTGLGLAIVQRLVRLMDGALVVESTPGQGTVIHCSLPFDEAVYPAPEQSAGQAITPPVEPLNLLVVEDDAVNRFTLKTLLKKIGYSAVCVDNGLEALEALTMRSFDCVITDIQMPIMDGMELTRRIREGDAVGIEPGEKVRELLGLDRDVSRMETPIPADIPIVALTAHAMEGDRERFLGMGMDYYLAKPVILAELAAILVHVGTLVRARKGS